MQNAHPAEFSGSSAVDNDNSGMELIINIIFGSFLAIRSVTGRRPRRLSLFMKFFWEGCPVRSLVNILKIK